MPTHLFEATCVLLAATTRKLSVYVFLNVRSLAAIKMQTKSLSGDIFDYKNLSGAIFDYKNLSGEVCDYKKKCGEISVYQILCGDPPYLVTPCLSKSGASKTTTVLRTVQDRSWFGAPVTSRIWKLRSVARWLVRTHLYPKNNPVHIGAII